MDFFNGLKKENGGYIFLSHSHSDIEKVRKIRNMLEEDGFEPLCFYLKCLNEDSEIEDLIKREIDAREWFLFLDSENSRKSKWVTMEREYIKRTNSKKILTLSIDDEQSVSETVQKIKRNLRVFLSCSARDGALARKIKLRLENKDYMTFYPQDDITAGDTFARAITSAIDEASRDGCVIVLITENSVHSKSTLLEIDIAMNKGGNIIPILIGDIEVSDAMRYYIMRSRWYSLPKNPSDEDIDEVIDRIGQSIVSE